MQCSAAHSAVQCSAVQRTVAVQCSAIQRSAAQCSAVQRSAVYHFQEVTMSALQPEMRTFKRSKTDLSLNMLSNYKVLYCGASALQCTDKKGSSLLYTPRYDDRTIVKHMLLVT